MKTTTRWTLALTAVAAVAALAWAFAPRPVGVETARVDKGRFEQAIEEDGRTRVRDAYTVSAPVMGRLARITLREGDTVRAGQPVAVLTPAMPSLQDDRSVREAQARLKAAQAGEAVARSRVEAARVALEQARVQLARSEQLAREGFLGAASLDHDRLALQAAQRELEAALGQQDVAAQERAQAAATLQPVSAASAGTAGTGSGAGRPVVLRAPVDGVVLRVTRTSEATVPAGTALVEIGDPERMEVLAELLTTDAVQAVPGTAAVVEGWGGPPVPAKVRRVEPAAFKKVSALGIEEQRVNVLLDVDTPPPEWRRMGDGFRVTVRVVTVAADDAVQVPVGALFPRPEGGMAVYRYEDGRARLQPVTLGGRNARVGWVREGLAPGQTVITYPPPAVADGGRVEERRP